MDDRHLELLFVHYLQHGQIFRNYAVATVKAYQSSFQFFLKQTGCKTLNEATREVMEKYLYDGRLTRNWSAVTFRQHHKHFNTFFKWCIKENYIEENPLDGIEKPKLEQKLPRKLTLEESQIVLDTSFHMKYAYRIERFRNRAIIGLMLFAGLRKKEVISLKMNDVNLEDKTLFIQQAKGSKDRMIPISTRLKIILEDYIKERKRLNRKSTQFITGVNEKRPFGNQGIKKLFERLRAMTKLDFTPHTLRHSFAILMLEGGCDIYILSKMMGHSKITTTTIYLMCSMRHMSKSIEMHQMN